MRIRKRSLDEADGFRQKGHGEDFEKVTMKRQFLLPLVAAVMEVEPQLSRDAPPQPTSCGIPERGIGIGAHARPLHNWKNALLRYNTDDQKLELGEEGKKADDRCKGIMRNGADKFRLVTNEAACMTEKASSGEKQEISGFGKERELQKSGRHEKSLLSIYRELGDDAVKKRSKQYHCLAHFNGEGNIGIKRTIEGTMEQHTSMAKYEAEEDDDDNDNNNHGGSRCRRRNGRGWRCSQRTLVGYSLCEHHLGKGRFKSVNTSISPGGSVVMGNKGSKVKQLHLIHAAYNVNLP